MVWSPPKLGEITDQFKFEEGVCCTNLTMRGGRGFSSVELGAGRFKRVEYATSIWSIARALSNGLTGT